MKCCRYLVMLNFQVVACYTSLSFAHARKRKIKKMWWFNEDEDELTIYDTIKGIYL